MYFPYSLSPLEVTGYAMMIAVAVVGIGLVSYAALISRRQGRR